jgi:hypothetical protein
MVAMKKKLTLRMDADVIERAKAYAAERGESVSKLVENYFAALTASQRPSEQEDTASYGPITRSLGAKPEEDVSEEDYFEYLWQKHQ